jgi:prepilin-type N-terminal cleavage/methylation domain-containing protein/prepilin-type processing-associated H-X9-DG protein
MRTRLRASRPSRAFTLIELLTVIAIIGILAAILIPVVGKVRSSARATQCASNLRQVGVGLQLFANENQGRLIWTSRDPGGPFVEWYKNLRPYVTTTPYRTGQLPVDPFRCPDSNIIAESHFSRSYHLASEYNNRNGSDPSHHRVVLGRMNAPSRIVVVLDAWQNATNTTVIPSEVGAGTTHRVASRHGGQANLLFADFHVERRDPATLPVGDKGIAQYPWENPN